MNYQHTGRRRGIYILPNLFTTAALFCGFYAILAATDGRYVFASVLIFFAMILDGCDGRVARLTNTASEFGVQYDSLADMVSFGVAPAMLPATHCAWRVLMRKSMWWIKPFSSVYPVLLPPA